uniref:Uncharacterized protein n=1 Tax=Compsopogon caeruleus TaxID=31354 RepID=A0A7S1TCU5_9RHOD|mmetsp:Transcript_14224/g.29110  ORF Transcript_14224/g.29110 Transcript_14224/m.29110 type:complete len:139 (+) Transcript_14224:207-623(+)|eukprot:CAMPEP_0184684306 /NCGR_PEP_ID=MMETSP0312-20130426/14794_1 /TAXON_ID=31354 /ORGANISM="Compsopogon coeruleus, Strain SAG 36.94" /LENGTH=138 /DNA_ID=CAMNT_0027137377 /DNA_START=191 /DNA_END=607 /DNA_ORIENTATION=+
MSGLQRGKEMKDGKRLCATHEDRSPVSESRSSQRDREGMESYKELERRMVDLEEQMQELEDENRALNRCIMMSYKILSGIAPGDDPTKELLRLNPTLDEALVRATLTWCQSLYKTDTSSNSPESSSSPDSSSDDPSSR